MWRFADFRDEPTGHDVSPAQSLPEFKGGLGVTDDRSIRTRFRFSKINEGIADATFLACAGLNRLGRNEISNPIETDDMLPAIAQGCIGIEQRKNDIEISKILSVINDKSASLRLAAERSLLLGLDGSCQTPIAGLAELNGQQMRLRGEVIRPDGSEVLQDEITCPVSEGVEMATLMAKRFRSQMGENFF